MKQYIGCDAHARYSIFVSMDENGKAAAPVRVEPDELEMRRFLRTLPAGSVVALETSGNWYWLVRAMEEAGLDPRLAPALEVKKRLPGRHKTDGLDAKGLALLLRNDALPEVWIAPAKQSRLKFVVDSGRALIDEWVRAGWNRKLLPCTSTNELLLFFVEAKGGH